MSNFVDLHHHLIYGVDDGAKSLENMQQMILRAAEEGITDLVCTSHSIPGVEPFPMDKYLAHLEEARDFIRQQGMALTLHAGSEILYTEAAARMLRERRLLTLGNSNVVLLEFSPDVSLRQLTEATAAIGMAGYEVLIAHVERYEALRPLKNVRALREEYGVRMQMNANTVLTKKGVFNDRWVRHMIGGGYIDCIATDAHNLSSRRCRMRDCHEALVEKYGHELADELCGGFQRRILEL